MSGIGLTWRIGLRTIIPVRLILPATVELNANVTNDNRKNNFFIVFFDLNLYIWIFFSNFAAAIDFQGGF